MAGDENRVIRKPELIAKIGLSDASIWRRERQGKFPRRIKLGGQAVGWLSTEIETWLNERANER